MLGDFLSGEELACPDITLDVLAETISGYRARYPQITCLVISLPGVEIDGVLSVADYPALRGERVSQRLHDATGLPVLLANDVNAAVLGYGAALGEAAHSETVIGIYWPQKYPPGAGILLKGELYQGRDGLAGEIAYAFGDAPQLPTGTPIEQAAKAVLGFVRYYNPHRMVLYHEGLAPQSEQEILQICGKRIPKRVLPRLVLDRNLRRDCEGGVQALARRFLEKQEEKGRGEHHAARE